MAKSTSKELKYRDKNIIIQIALFTDFCIVAHPTGLNRGTLRKITGLDSQELNELLSRMIEQGYIEKQEIEITDFETGETSKHWLFGITQKARETTCYKELSSNIEKYGC